MDRKVEIINDEKGRLVVIHDIRFKGKRKIDWKEVERYLKEYVGQCYEIAQSAEKIYIGSDFPDEFAGSKDTERLKGTLAKAKANASQGIPELIQIGKDCAHINNVKSRHRNDAKYGWYRYEARFALPITNDRGDVLDYNIYKIYMLVRHANSGKRYLYDFINIQKEKEPSTPPRPDAVR